MQQPSTFAAILFILLCLVVVAAGCGTSRRRGMAPRTDGAAPLVDAYVGDGGALSDGGVEADGAVGLDGGGFDSGPTGTDGGPIGIDSGPVGTDAGPACADGDSDRDGVCDASDRCDGWDDRIDVDRDGVPDGCDCDARGGECDINASCRSASGGITCSCDIGYDGDGFDCVPVDCGVLRAPVDGFVSAPVTTYGATATYGCDMGFDLQGLRTRTCRDTATWSGSAPTCDPIGGGTLTCVCGSRFSAGQRVRLTADNPDGSDLLIGATGRALVGNAGGSLPILIEWDSWTGGHGGRCSQATCGSCTDSGTSRWWVECGHVAPL